MFGFLVLVVYEVTDRLVMQHIQNVVYRYNLRRVLRLVMVLLLGLTAISAVFANWYAAVLSFGIVSVILGFALQSPTTSFIAWIYILFRRPYRVGDRIQLEGVSGDVIDISYLDTTLWEFGGQYLSTDHPSGRIIKFPNSKVLNSIVFNYSWENFPYIWNEVKFQVAYDSDLSFVAETMERITLELLGDAMSDRVETYQEILSNTAIDGLNVKKQPTVVFRPNNTWIEVICRYLVIPREQGRVRSNLTFAMLQELKKHPDRVLFPMSNLR